MGQKLGQREIDMVVDAIESRLPQGVKDFAKWYSESDERANQRLRKRGYTDEQINSASQQQAQYTNNGEATQQLLETVSDKTNVALPLVMFGAAVAEYRAFGKATGSITKKQLQNWARQQPAKPAYAMTPEQQANINRAFQGMPPDQVAAQARGTMKQFLLDGGQLGGGGSYGVSDAIEDGLTITSRGGSGTGGRPSARAASPALDFKAGEYGRKADQQQYVRDRLNKTRSSGTPTTNPQSSAPGAVTTHPLDAFRDDMNYQRSKRSGKRSFSEPETTVRAADDGEIPGVQIRGGNRPEPVQRSKQQQQQARTTLKRLLRGAKKRGDATAIQRIEQRLKNVK